MKRDVNMNYGEYEPDHFAIFEKLPAIVRRALADADYNWQTGWVHNIYTITGSAAETIAAIRRADVSGHKDVAKKERRIVFGHRSRPIHSMAA